MRLPPRVRTQPLNVDAEVGAAHPNRVTLPSAPLVVTARATFSNSSQVRGEVWPADFSTSSFWYMMRSDFVNGNERSLFPNCGKRTVSR